MELQVWYMRPEHFRNGVMGLDFCFVDKQRVPDPDKLAETHIYLKTIETTSYERGFVQMQGDVWSPNGEARQLIEGKGLKHTSMSVGDIFVGPDNSVWVVENLGFADLRKWRAAHAGT